LMRLELHLLSPGPVKKGYKPFLSLKPRIEEICLQEKELRKKAGKKSPKEGLKKSPWEGRGIGSPRKALKNFPEFSLNG